MNFESKHFFQIVNLNLKLFLHFKIQMFVYRYKIVFRATRVDPW